MSLPKVDYCHQMLALFLQADLVVSGDREARYPYQQRDDDKPRLQAITRRKKALARAARVTMTDLERAADGARINAELRTRLWRALGYQPVLPPAGERPARKAAP